MGVPLCEEGAREAIIKIPKHTDERSLQLFKKECELLSRLGSPYVARVLDYGETVIHDRQYPYLIMEFIKGQTLAQRLSHGRMRWREVKSLLLDVGRALKYMAAQGVCHRDIKPSNIIFDSEQNHWVLMDFGIAADYGKGLPTTTSSNAGTWDYMAPEQRNGGTGGDVRGDIYSLGLVAWEALLGESPRPGSAYPHEAGVPGVAAKVDELIKKMVQPNPAARYQTPEDLLKAVRYGAVFTGRIERVKLFWHEFWKWTIRCVLILATVFVVWLVLDYVVAINIESDINEVLNADGDNIRGVLNKIDEWDDKFMLGLGGKCVAEQRKIYDGELEKRGVDKDVECREIQADNTDRKLRRMKNFVHKWEKNFPDDPVIVEWKSIVGGLEAVDEAEKAYRDNPSNGNFAELMSRIDMAKLKLDDSIRKDLLNKKQAEYQAEHWNIWAAGIKAKLPELTTPGSVNEILGEIEALENEYGHHEQFDKIKDELKQRERSLEKKASEDTMARINDAVSRHEFGEALHVLRLYGKLYPHSVEINREKQMELERQIFHNYYKYIASLIDHLESFNKETGNFRALARQYSANVSQESAALQRILLRSIHTIVGDVANDENLDPNIRMNKINGLPYRECSPEQRDYLDSLVSAAVDFIGNNSSDAKQVFQHVWQRPPADLGPIAKPTVWRLAITKVSVKLSGEDYDDIRGIWDADPYFKLIQWDEQKDEPDDKWEPVQGPVNQPEFSIQPQFGYIYFDCNRQAFKFEVGDCDTISSSPMVSDKVRLIDLKNASGSITKWIGHGTTVTITYNLD